MINVTLSTKGQVVIPKAVRDQLRLEPGASLSLEIIGSRIVLGSSDRKRVAWRKFQGSLKGHESTAEIMAEAKREEREIEDRDLAGL